jgi:hypothetical protein
MTTRSRWRTCPLIVPEAASATCMDAYGMGALPHVPQELCVRLDADIATGVDFRTTAPRAASSRASGSRRSSHGGQTVDRSRTRASLSLPLSHGAARARGATAGPRAGIVPTPSLVSVASAPSVRGARALDAATRADVAVLMCVMPSRVSAATVRQHVPVAVAPLHVPVAVAPTHVSVAVAPPHVHVAAASSHVSDSLGRLADRLDPNVGLATVAVSLYTLVQHAEQRHCNVERAGGARNPAVQAELEATRSDLASAPPSRSRCALTTWRSRRWTTSPHA